ncbi:MAG: hypothetical protein U0003_06065 [Vampirovibrionales bacterium]
MKRFLLLLALVLSVVTSMPAWAQTCSYSSNAATTQDFEKYYAQINRSLREPALKEPHAVWPAYQFIINPKGMVEKSILVRSSGDNSFDTLWKDTVLSKIAKQPYVAITAFEEFIYPLSFSSLPLGIPKAEFDKKKAEIDENNAFMSSLVTMLSNEYRKEIIKAPSTKAFHKNFKRSLSTHTKEILEVDIALMVEAKTGNVLSAWVYSSSCNKEYDNLELELAKSTQVFKKIPAETIQRIQKIQGDDVFTIVFTSTTKYRHL